MTKGFVIVLTSSLILNVFLGGIVVGNYLKASYAAPPSTRRMFQHIIKLLPEATQTQVIPLIQKHVEAIKVQERQVKLARQSVYEHLSTPHFDPERLSETLTKFRQEKNKIQERMHAGLLEITRQLSFEERKQLAKLFKQSYKNLNNEEKITK